MDGLVKCSHLKNGRFPFRYLCLSVTGSKLTLDRGGKIIQAFPVGSTIALQGISYKDSTQDLVNHQSQQLGSIALPSKRDLGSVYFHYAH